MIEKNQAWSFPSTAQAAKYSEVMAKASPIKLRRRPSGDARTSATERGLPKSSWNAIGVRRLVQEVVRRRTVEPQIRELEEARSRTFEVKKRAVVPSIRHLSAGEQRVEVNQREPEVLVLALRGEAEAARPRCVAHAAKERQLHGRGNRRPGCRADAPGRGTRGGFRARRESLMGWERSSELHGAAHQEPLAQVIVAEVRERSLFELSP